MALRGLKVIEMMGLAPGPYCGMVLADFGANVTVVHKTDGVLLDAMSNGKRMIGVDLKSTEGRTILKKLCMSADIFLDIFRPGVMEKLGLGPEALMKDNPKLIYARLTGFGQTGAFAHKAGHDINFIALSGVLSLLSKNKQPPNPPINILGDFGGGGLMCVMGILLALYERCSSGRGQVIDASMLEGSAYLSSWLFKSRNQNVLWGQEPGNNPLDGGAAFYGTYKTKDDKFMAVGAIEPQFYDQFLIGLGLNSDDFYQYGDQNVYKEKFSEIFSTKTQNEWCEIFDKLDACVTPVLDLDQLNNTNESRKSFYKDVDAKVIPNIAPRLSRTPGTSLGYLKVPSPGQHSIEILKELGYSEAQIENFLKNGQIFAQRKSNI